ncbi:MAG: hypothetical protein K1Y36_15395, partial [Blastocatellia bacterium]|nr:hypothetical protein [Blastocatellia bacterium]
MPGPGNLEMYLAEQMRTLIRARQAQDQALREIRSLGEQLTVGDAPVRVREQYNQALRNWQESRRDGVNARQKLLVAMTDRSALDRH